MSGRPGDTGHPTACSTENPWRRSLPRTVLGGVQVALVGGVAAALAESQLAAVSARASGAGLLLRAGAAGSFVATHLALWGPALAVLSIPLGVLAARERFSRRLGPVEGVQAGVLLLAGGALVLPGDLMLARKLTAAGHLGCMAVAALLAAGIWFLLRKATRCPAAYRRFRSALGVATIVALLAACAALAAMFRTPFAGARVFRLPPVRAPGAEAPSDRPNIVLVMLDTVRADRLSCYGYDAETTPELERFAARATVYERAVANGIWTVPSHASLFTGLAVRTHGMNHHHMRLDDKYDTLAELLKRAGYQTVCLSGNPWVSAEFNMTQGFEVEVSALALRRLGKSFAEAWCERLGLPPPFPWLDKDLGAGVNNYLFARWMDRDRDPGKPFFIFLNYMDAHLPYAVPREVRRRFLDRAQVARSYQLSRRAYGGLVNLLTARYNFLDSDCIAPEDRAVLAGQYDACLYYLDWRLGELLRAVDRHGLRDNTVVVLVSDHGEALGEHAQWAHEYGVYDTLLHVPLLVRDGRSPGRRRVSEAVLISDLFPTILHWAGLAYESPAGSPSRDLLARAAAPERVVVGEQIVHNEHRLRWASRRDPRFDRRRFTRKWRAVVGRRYKYIRASDGRDELYDLQRDPGETNNLIDEPPPGAARLSTSLDSWLQAVPEYAPPASGYAPGPDADVLETLRGLGYAGG